MEGVGCLNTAGLKNHQPVSRIFWGLATLLNGLTYPLSEIVLAGTRSKQKHREFLAKGYRTAFSGKFVTSPEFPLRNKPVEGPAQFFFVGLCLSTAQRSRWLVDLQNLKNQQEYK
jgi:hypothetical protein